MINTLRQVIIDLHKEGKTFLVIEHDMKFVMGICENVFVLDFGEKISEGPPGVIQKDENVVKAYLGTTYDLGN
jgi:branched-chain amino acid transport system ATP-binding protein